METVFPVMFGLPDNEALQDLNAAADYLNAMSGATGKVGAIGFCSGGRHTLLFACNSNKVNAAIDCWGGFIHRATPDAETTPARPKPPLDMVAISDQQLELKRDEIVIRIPRSGPGIEDHQQHVRAHRGECMSRRIDGVPYARRAGWRSSLRAGRRWARRSGSPTSAG